MNRFMAKMLSLQRTKVHNNNLKIVVLEQTEIKKIVKKTFQVLSPLILGVGILWWVYRDFAFDEALKVLKQGMRYDWMLLSLFFGVLSHVLRGWRWQLSLAPLGEYPSKRICVYAIFVSYAANLVVPRVGEVSRCGILSKYQGTSFAKSLGTVVSERAIDMLCAGLITGATLLLQAPVFAVFFQRTGTDVERFSILFSSAHLYIFIICLIAAVLLLFFLIRNIALFAKLKGILHNIWQGIWALRGIKSVPLFILYTIGIWLCYFLEFYLTFYCFDFSASLGVQAGLVMFVVGTLAVIVPTPNGAGPWHFAVMTMMMLYGVGKEDAGIFALLVHGIQTFLLILLGIYGTAVLPLLKNYKNYEHNS